MKPITKAEAKKKFREKFEYKTELGLDQPPTSMLLDNFESFIDEIYDSLKELKMEEIPVRECQCYEPENCGCMEEGDKDVNETVKEINLKIDNLCLNTKP
uniref:Uncharacterized protein n=1 Tax=viral metagenome TaxID=1070528 RepID=A0A6M3KQ38_9ZZZZ